MKIETWKTKTNLKIELIKAKYIFVLFALILFIFSGIKIGKIMNEYVYWQKTKDIYNAALINVPIDYSHLKPFRNWRIGNLEGLSAKGAIVLATESEEAENKIIFRKNISEMFPIASLSKIVSAYVVLKNYELEQKTIITQGAVDTEEEKGQFRVGQEFTVNELLYSMLVESSNDAARALAEIIGEKKFVGLMNSEIKKIGIKHTHFVDPIGLDPDFPNQAYNYSTADDLAKFVQYILEQAKTDAKIAKIFEITKNTEHMILLSNGNQHHKAQTTDKLLEEFPNIVGGKTGQTPKAKQCLLIILPQPKSEQGYLVSIILGSNNRFGEMKQIINWLEKGFIW